MTSRLRPSITAWPTHPQKARFAALAARRGLSESKLLGLMIDSVLGSNAVELAVEGRQERGGRGDHISVRLRPGDGERLRQRARARGMHYTTYAAVMIRAHLRANPPMPHEELTKLDRSLAEVSAMGRSLSQIARSIRDGQGIDPGLRLDLATVLQTVERLRHELREVVRVNRISWESADAEAAP